MSNDPAATNTHRFMGEAAYAATPANRAGAVVRTHAHAPLAARVPPPDASPADQAAFESAARAANLTEHLAPLDDFPDAAQRTLAAAAYYDLFLSYSADFASGVPNPPGSGYHWSLQSTRLGLSADFARRLAMRRGAAAAAPALATADVSEPVPMPAPAADGGRFVMPWMCLEDCGATAAQIAAQLAQLATPGVFTAAAFEDYDLGADGTVNKTGARSRVSGAVKAMGLGSHAMIVSWDLDPIRLVFANPQRFIDSVISKILDVEGSNVTAINLDWEPHGSAPPLGPVPTPADGAAYAAFLDVFAKAMHARGVQVSVDIATWTDFWDYRAIGATAVDCGCRVLPAHCAFAREFLFPTPPHAPHRLPLARAGVCDMETYSASLSAFTKQVAFAAPLVPASKYVVGLETHPFNVSELASRFSYLKSMQINKVAIWDTPMPDAWMPYLAAV